MSIPIRYLLTLQAVFTTANSAVVKGTLMLSLVFRTLFTTAATLAPTTVKNLFLFKPKYVRVKYTAERDAKSAYSKKSYSHHQLCEA